MPDSPENHKPYLDEDTSVVDEGLEQTDVLPPTAMVGGKYRLGRLIGEGGMGAVYEAEHTGLEMRVAVKLLNEVFITDHNAMRRFQREAKAAAAIRHPNVVEVTDTGTDDEGAPFIVMELLEGESLSALLRRERLLSPLVACTITSQILAGLAAAHAKGVIHRDLKPGNIVLARTGSGSCQVKILDFGISKFFTEEATQDVTATGAVIGTPRFMAPEQARGQGDLDGRVDIYAVGVLLYRMLTGKLPFAAKTHEEIIQHILEGEPRPPRELRADLPEDLERVILKAMAPDREERYPTAHAFLEDLHAVMPEVIGGTVQITAHTGTTSAMTPVSLVTPDSAIAQTAGRTTGPHTRPASPKALRAATPRSRRVWLVPLLVLVALGGALGWYLHTRDSDTGAAGATTEADAGMTFAGPPFRLGITRYLPKGQLMKEHRPLIDYLSRRLQRNVKLEIYEDYIDLSSRLAEGKLELAALSSYAYVRAKRRLPGIKLIGTHVTTGGTSYEGYIVAEADAGIQTLHDLEGKVFCYVSPNSTSGYLYPRAVFREKGMEPDKAFKATRFTGDHLSALRALEGGACDGAAVFAGIFFEAQKHGMPPQKFTILATTARIPYDAYCVPPELPEEIVHSLREALLALKPGTETAQKVLGSRSRIIGFAPAQDSDWDPVRRIEKHLDVPLKGQERE